MSVAPRYSIGRAIGRNPWREVLQQIERERENVVRRGGRRIEERFGDTTKMSGILRQWRDRAGGVAAGGGRSEVKRSRAGSSHGEPRTEPRPPEATQPDTLP